MAYCEWASAFGLGVLTIALVRCDTIKQLQQLHTSRTSRSIPTLRQATQQSFEHKR